MRAVWNERARCLQAVGNHSRNLSVGAEAGSKHRTQSRADSAGTAEAAVWYRRLQALLERRNRLASVMRIYRLYRAEGLAVRRLRRKRISRVAIASHTGPIESGMGVGFCVRHTGDGTRDWRASGGGCLYERKPFLRSRHQSAEVDTSLPELTSRHFLSWCEEQTIQLIDIQPGKPMQNGHVESLF